MVLRTWNEHEEINMLLLSFELFCHKLLKTFGLYQDRWKKWNWFFWTRWEWCWSRCKVTFMNISQSTTLKLLQASFTHSIYLMATTEQELHLSNHNHSTLKKTVHIITLNFVGLTKWKTNTSPSTKLWSMENPLHPPLRPDLCARYFVWELFPFPSSKTITVSSFGKCSSQNFLQRPYFNK